MTDYTKSTGNSGTMMIRDLGTQVEFWINSNNSTTFNNELPWAYVVNGVSSSWQEYRYTAGAGWRRLGYWQVTTSQTVTFKLGATGTSGFGGPTNFSVAINRAKAPSPPSMPAISNITSSSVFATFSDGNNGGAAIDSRQLGYGVNSGSPTTIVGSDGSTDIGGLQAGTLYYIWARTHNAKGYSGWSARNSFRTLGGVRINVNGVWKTAVPYVKVNGVWRPARPWCRNAGVWKETT